MKVITCPNCNTEINTTQRKKELQAIPAVKTDLHKLVSSMYDVQHMRLIFEGRFRTIKDNRYAIYADRLHTIESGIKDDMEQQTKMYPIHEWIIAQKGLSYDIAGQLIGIIQDIKKFDNISKMWAYFGLAVVDVCQKCNRQWLPPEEKAKKILHIKERQKEQEEKKVIKSKSSDIIPAESMVCNCEHPNIKKTSQKLKKDVLLDYNPTAKMVAFKTATQFLMAKGFYYDLYTEFKTVYESRTDLKEEADKKKGKQTKGKNGTVVETKGTAHIHAMAQRKMIKIFLQHLWVTWRKLENLPTSEPYVIAHLKHTNYIQPSPI